MSKLVIVESPAKAKTIEKYLGKDFKVVASMGHLRDLPRKKIGIEIENNFKPIYIPIDGKEKLIGELQDAVSRSDFVYLATDPDREGEAISWHLKMLLSLDDSNSKRVTFNEITKKAVQEAMKNPREIDGDLVDAQQARRMLDRLVGYKLSPFLWKKVRRGLSAGRVQSVATRLVVDREREIQGFVPEEYWSIDAKFGLDKTAKNNFDGHYHGTSAGKVELKNKGQTEEVLKDIDGKDFFVSKLKKGKKKRSPSPPFITSSLQQEAYTKLNMTAKRTMSTAQEIYEGVNIQGHGLTGLITYMRTDSLRLSDDALDSAKQFIIKRYGEKYYPPKTRVFKTKGAAQDAHEAIRPTNVDLEPDLIKSSLSQSQYRLYKLIWSRFVACQMADASYDTVSAEISCGQHIFKSSGQKMNFAGFTALYEDSGRTGENQSSVKILPEFSENDKIFLKEITPNQHFTQPPARYSEATLIKAMEEKGIGRPSTYAPTITTILDRDYVEKGQKTLKPTMLGETVTDLMIDKFNDIVDTKFTAKMEDQLDEIEAGKTVYTKVLDKFYKGFEDNLTKAEKDLDNQRIKIKEEPTDIVCELCGQNMVIKYGRFGKFLACPSYPDCKNTKAITEDAGVLCPLCGSKVVKKKSKKGYEYLGCEKNHICEFMTWDKPVPNTPCPKCGEALFKHYDRETKKSSYVCHKAACGYVQEISKGKKIKKDTGEDVR